MNRILFILACSLATFHFKNSWALDYSHKEIFCRDRQSLDFIKNMALDSDNLMGVKNRGGFAMGGVCWWHSRFQRNGLYLTTYAPTLPKASKSELIDLIKKIRSAEQVVEIPGYANFYEFSYENKYLIQDELNKWQKDDTLSKFAWIDGLKGDSIVKPHEFKNLMNEFYKEVEVNKRIAYAKLQIPGITSHSWLILRMEKVTGGYDLEILDSNVARYSEIYQYREGQRAFRYHTDHSTVSASLLQNRFDEGYKAWVIEHNFKKDFIVPGFEYHRWAPTGLEKINNGYRVQVNIYSKKTVTPRKISYDYHYGETQINFAKFAEPTDDPVGGYSKKFPASLISTEKTYNFTTYLEQVEEMDQIDKTISTYCQTQNEL